MSRHLFALSLVAGALVAGATEASCGGVGGTLSTGVGGGTTSGPTTSASVGGGAPMTTNHSFDKALPITIDAAQIAATLVDVDTPDYYTFSGTQGDRIVIQAVAEDTPTNTHLFDPTIIDTAVTLYDAAQTPIAASNDEWPKFSTDSLLYVELPSTGTFYVKVEDCNAYAKAHPAVQCNDKPATGVTTFDYALGVSHTSKAPVPEVNAGAMQDGTTAQAVKVAYKTQPPGVYGPSVIDGSFASTTDTHVFAFTPPMDAMVDANQRARAEFFLQPPGHDDGDGSTSNVELWVTDDAAGQHVIAKVDDSKRYTTGDALPVDGSGPLDLSLPVKLGQPYYLFVKSTAATGSPTTDAYFIRHLLNPFYGTPEQSTPHSTSATAQVATFPDLKNPSFYDFDGDISAPGTAAKPDVDWYQMTVPTQAQGMRMGCDVARAGSGLIGFTAAFYDESGTTQLGTTLGPEMADPTHVFGTTSAIAVKGGSTVYVEYTAAMQDPVNTGTAYRCLIRFQ